MLVGFVRSGIITAGTSSRVVHVTKPGWEVVELDVGDELHAIVDELTQGFVGFSVPSLVVVFIRRNCSTEVELELPVLT